MSFFEEGELRSDRRPTLWDILDRMDAEIYPRSMTWEQVTGANIIQFRRGK